MRLIIKCENINDLYNISDDKKDEVIIHSTTKFNKNNEFKLIGFHEPTNNWVYVSCNIYESNPKLNPNNNIFEIASIVVISDRNVFVTKDNNKWILPKRYCEYGENHRIVAFKELSNLIGRTRIKPYGHNFACVKHKVNLFGLDWDCETRIFYAELNDIPCINPENLNSNNISDVDLWLINKGLELYNNRKIGNTTLNEIVEYKDAIIKTMIVGNAI